MKFFRHDKVKKKVLWFTTVIIILSFGVFGTAYLIAGNQGGNDYAGAIFGQKIKISDFVLQQKHAEIQAIMRYGDKYNEVRDYLNLDGETWSRLILIQEAKRRKINATDEQVVAAIERLPYFQRNGQYDTLIYNDVLRYVFKIKPREFEEGVRDNIRISKIFENETRQVQISTEEVFAAYKKDNEKTKVKYVLIEPDAFINESQYNETEARLYWAENKNDFTVPSAINIAYMNFPLPETENEDEKDAVRAEVDSIIEKIKEGETFHETAEELEIEVKETGFFTKEDPILSLGWSFEMLNTLFRFQESQMAGPFELDDRLVLVNVLEKKESYVPDYEEITDKAKLAYLKNQAKDATRTKTEEYLQQIKSDADPDFENAASSLGLNVQETPSFTRGEYLPKIGISKEFETAAFQLTATERISNVVELSNGFAILFLEEYTDVTQSEFDDNKSAVKNTLLQEKRNQTFNEFMTRLRLEARVFDNIARMRQAATPQQTQ